MVVGCHYDAWGYGAVDPGGGTAIITEIARAFSLMVKKGEKGLNSSIQYINIEIGKDSWKLYHYLFNYPTSTVYSSYHAVEIKIQSFYNKGNYGHLREGLFVLSCRLNYVL